MFLEFGKCDELLGFFQSSPFNSKFLWFQANSLLWNPGRAGDGLAIVIAYSKDGSHQPGTLLSLSGGEGWSTTDTKRGRICSLEKDLSDFRAICAVPSGLHISWVQLDDGQALPRPSRRTMPNSTKFAEPAAAVLAWESSLTQTAWGLYLAIFINGLTWLRKEI